MTLSLKLASRRGVLAALAVAPAALVISPARAAPPRPILRMGPAYTEKTAPDKLSREILARRLSKLDQGAPSGMHPGQTIHRNFAQIIEQNLARMDPARMTRLMSNMSAAELSDLAQLYTTATADLGRSPFLLDVMATRLSGSQLGMVSQHFGFAPVYEAVFRAAPAKALEFQQNSSTMYVGPAPGLAQFGPQGRFAPSQKTLGQYGVGSFLNYTPYEIYLSFRTAPIGSLAVSGALYESTIVMSTAVGQAFGTGFAIGTYIVAPLIQTYAPSLWDAIGGTINQIIVNIQNIMNAPTPAKRGEAESQGAGLFNLGSVGDLIGSTGGDFDVAQDWYDWAGGSGGGGCGRYLDCDSV